MKNHKVLSSISGVIMLGLGVWLVRDWRSTLVLVMLGIILAGVYYLLGNITKNPKNTSRLIPPILLSFITTFLIIRVLNHLGNFRSILGIVGGALTSFSVGIIVYSLLWEDTLVISRKNKKLNITRILTVGTLVTLILAAIFVLTILWG